MTEGGDVTAAEKLISGMPMQRVIWNYGGVELPGGGTWRPCETGNVGGGPLSVKGIWL